MKEGKEGGVTGLIYMYAFIVSEGMTLKMFMSNCASFLVEDQVGMPLFQQSLPAYYTAFYAFAQTDH